MTYYGLLFLAGIAGSMHCAGMCGGFACALGGSQRGAAANIIRHLTYNLGRIVTYCFIGALIGQLGILLIGHAGEDSWASTMQRVFACLSGLLMVIVGLQFFGWFNAAQRLPGAVGVTLVRSMKQVLSTTDPRAPLALGVLNGFLPCPLVYAFAAQAAGSGGALPGFMVMLLFGLGTLPVMLAMGAIGLHMRHKVTAAWRISGVHIAGVFMLLLGIITLVRGVLPMSAHLHIT
ncbi:MAG TPA: sulfite exporter TauE/SafE family protein [Gammaproteobacteria bacterium]